MLCRACRSDWQNRMLQRVMAEHLGMCGEGLVTRGVGWVWQSLSVDAYDGVGGQWCSASIYAVFESWPEHGADITRTSAVCERLFELGLLCVSRQNIYNCGAAMEFFDRGWMHACAAAMQHHVMMGTP